MKILGISLGDTSTAAITIDEHVVACVSEERFTRIKRDESYPIQAITYCLEVAGLRGDQLDAVAIGGDWDFWRCLTRYFSQFSIKDLVREQEDYWRPLLYTGRKVDWPKLFKDKWDTEQFPGSWGSLTSRLGPDLALNISDRAVANSFLDEVISAHLGIERDRIVRVDHHTALGAYAYWSSALRGKEAGVVVLGAGDDSIGASIASPLQFGLMRLGSVSSRKFCLGRMMRDVTLMLGMPPRDHDPVVMGLAGNAPESQWRPAYRVFEKSIRVEGWDFRELDA